MRARQTLLLIAGLTVLALSPAAALAGAPTTYDRTIGDADLDNRIDEGSGEAHIQRLDLCSKKACPNPTPKDPNNPIFHLAHPSDIHIVDGESPSRREDLDGLALFGFSAAGAYRPQEELTPQMADATVKTLNRVTSPISGLSPQLVVQTGDNADNKQLNELRWNIDIFDGALIDPDSGIDPPGVACAGDEPKGLYQGVRGQTSPLKYYDPVKGNPDGRGYSPDPDQNLADRGVGVSARDFTGGDLLEAAQAPFKAEGLDMPWLTVRGNHDGQWQGLTQDPFLAPPPTAHCKDLDGNGSFETRVKSDPRRRFVDDYEWIEEHFNSPPEPGPVGHGLNQGTPKAFYALTQDELSVIPKGWRFISIDGIAEFAHNGILRDGGFGEFDQWALIEQNLQAAQKLGQKVLFFSHHPVYDLNNTVSNPPGGRPDMHCGSNEAPTFPFPQAPNCRDLGTESLVELACRYRDEQNKTIVKAFINGHAHRNKISTHQEQDDCGIWEITTSATIDWGGQSRLIEAFANQDGTLSIFTTMVDFQRPLYVKDPDLSDPSHLASVGGELSLNDWQAESGLYGSKIDAKGTPEDRNVQLVVG